MSNLSHLKYLALLRSMSLSTTLLNSGVHMCSLLLLLLVGIHMVSKTRFILPLMFAIAGISASIYTIYIVTRDLPSFDWIFFIEGSLYTDILFVLGAAVPIIILEYFIVAIPIAVIFLFANRAMKSPTYHTSIMKIGEKFGGMRIIRRAAAPALFSVSSSGLLVGLLKDYLFGVPPVIPPSIQFLYPMSLTLMGALIIMPLALAFFIPTWILNDSGIVTHLKDGELDNRQCPDTEGVGRWYSSMISGYSLVSFPLSMFYAHFWVPYVDDPTPLVNNPMNLLISGIWTIGIPLMIMAFIVPVVLLNERFRERSTGIVKRMARRLGADEAKLPRIEKL